MEGKGVARTNAPKLDVGSRTHAGRRRRHNEDALFAKGNVFVVADGVGGRAGGAVAATEAVRVFSGLTGRRDATAEAVAETVERANANVLAMAHADAKLRGMATTLAGLVFADQEAAPRWILCTVGDSRIYRFADGALGQVSTDHSEVSELVGAGALTPDQAARYPRRHVLTRALGRVDAHHPDIRELPLHPRETFLICTDGLTTELADDDIAVRLAARGSAQETAAALVAGAVDAGGRDNVTAIVVTLTEEVS